MPIRSLHEDREIRRRALRGGHIRLGKMEKGHPTQSSTFVFTSDDPHRLYPLAQNFGGEVERYEPQGAGEEPWRLVSEVDSFTALLPFATFEENFEQSYELWGSGGIKRMCEGPGFMCRTFEVDEVTGEIAEDLVPCICDQTGRDECKATSHLYLFLPQTGLIVWELITGSKVAAIELYDQLRLVQTVAGDRMNQVPVRLGYAMRRLHYVDPKTRERKPTTKRIVSISIPGDARTALAALTLPVDRALLAAVNTVLGEGRPALGAGPSDPDVPTLPAPSSEVDLASTEQPSGSAMGGTSTGGSPATEEHWSRAKAAGLAPAKVLRRVRELHPDAQLTRAQDVTTEQLAEVLEEVLSA